MNQKNFVQTRVLFGFSPVRLPRRVAVVVIISFTAAAASLTAAMPGAIPPRAHRPSPEAEETARQVEIRRTDYGVVHIKAENLRAAGFGMGYVQVEDYGDQVIRGLVSARGELARIEGRRQLNTDARNRERYTHAVETYHHVPTEVRAVLEGFADGVNHYIRRNPDDVPAWAEPYFTGHDVAARDIGWYSAAVASRFVRRLQSGGVDETDPDDAAPHPDDGSNTWALNGSRTTSGHAILMRNPHLMWTAGYYEAHITVPGVLDFYGDFRIGGSFGIIGGFNRHLGWSTTNNDVRGHEFYVLETAPDSPDHVLFDGGTLPITTRTLMLRYRDGDGEGEDIRESRHTPLGPVIHEDGERVYVIRDAHHGQYRMGEQWLAMMRAANLDEWLDAMRLRARPSSNFHYADRDDNIFYVWNAALPDLPHPPGDDRTAFRASGSDEVWTRLVPFENLPQLLNPKGGYLRNENDSPHYTNMHQVLDADDFPPNVERPRLRLRSQHGIELLHNDERFSLEDNVRLKHSMRILLADRAKADLLAAVREGAPDPEVAAAADLLESWDNTVARESRGAVLFAEWWDLYKTAAGGSGHWFARNWTEEDPVNTPRGLGNPEAAARAFADAVAQTKEQFGSWDVAWGDVHRVRIGDLDLPVGGATGELGAFRIFGFRGDDDGKRRVIRGDCWVLAVEFSDPPRARSILAYGQSNREDSPHHTDQAALFAANEMKEVAFTEEQIQAKLIRRYHPGHPDLPLNPGSGGSIDDQP